MSNEVAAHAAMVIDKEASWTLPYWCAQQPYSLTTFYKLEKLGLTPEVTRIPGTKICRITAAARREYEARISKLSRDKGAKRELERRRAQTAAAGRLAAASPLHVSKIPPHLRKSKRGKAVAR
jgi:hypothetical protein